MTTPAPMNRILAAFSQGQGESLQRKQLSQQEEEKQKQLELQQQAQEERAKQFQQQYDLELQNFELRKKAEEANRAIRDFEFKRHIGDALRTGEIRPDRYSKEQIDAVAGGGSPTGPDELNVGGQTFNTRDFGSAEEIAKRKGTAKMLEMRPLVDLELEGKKSLLDFEYGRRGDLEKIEGENALNLYTKRSEHETALQAQKDEEALKRSKVTAGATLGAANIRANAAKVAAAIRASGQKVDEDALTRDAEMAATGFLDSTGDSKIDVKTRSVMSASGLKPFTPKKADAFKNLTQFKDILADMDEYIGKYGSGGWGTIANTLKAGVPLIPTDIKADTDQLKGRAAKVATFMGEIGRKTEGDITRALQTMTAPGQTKEKMQAARTKLIRDFGTSMKSLLGGLSKEQQKLILDKYEVDGEIRAVVEGKDPKAPKGAPKYLDAEGNPVYE
jgi:hypothetical protein